jgi:ABC-type branched-subunit amino acid transport system permease subunit
MITLALAQIMCFVALQMPFTGGIFVVCVLAFRRGIVGEIAAMLKK